MASSSQFSSIYPRLGFNVALISCPECNTHPVSDQAIACPKCGFPISSRFTPQPLPVQDQRAQLLKSISVEVNGNKEAVASLTTKSEMFPESSVYVHILDSGALSLLAMRAGEWIEEIELYQPHIRNIRELQNFPHLKSLVLKSDTIDGRLLDEASRLGAVTHFSLGGISDASLEDFLQLSRMTWLKVLDLPHCKFDKRKLVDQLEDLLPDAAIG